MRCYIRVFLILISALMFRKVRTWGSNKVLLKDVTALTLHKGHMTTGRRSSPVPQLKCVGGSAGCYKFTPQTVQCQNVGFDGNEVQWECKCDMDDSYRFGKVQVTCEGYDYPDDPYILKGSCGLEYTIDYTESGRARNNDYAPSWKSNDSGGGGWIFFFILIFIIVFMICKMGGSHDSSTPYPEPHRPNHHSDSHHSGRNDPPPYGFKREYTQPQPEYQPPPPTYTDATQGHHGSSTYTRNDHHSETRSSPYGGFWSGLGLGGIGGYLFGSRQRNRYNGNPGYGGYWGNNRGWGSSWGNNGGWGRSWGNNGGWGSSWGSSSTTYRRSPGSSSSGTSRTTSGYGGTSRR